MVEGMVETTTITKSRKFLVTVYLFILLMISVVIAILLLLYNEEKKLKDTDIERYAEIQMDLIKRSDESASVAEDIVELQRRISEPGLDLKNKVVVIDELISLFQKQVEIASESIELNDEILQLSVDAEFINDAENNSIAAEAAIEDYKISIEILEKEGFVIMLQEEISKTLNCYNSIKTEQTSTKLESSINKCRKEMDKTLSILNTPQVDFLYTQNYLDEIKNYWGITLQLNVAIETQNERSANKLTKELETSSVRKSDLEEKSLTELQMYIDTVKEVDS